MYYYIKGTLVQKNDNYIVVDANGVGYMIYTSLNSMENAGEVGKKITIYTYLHVREDVMDLFGFTTIEEKNMFMQLISVSGVGPKAALSILSVTTPAKFAVAVITNDVKTITKASGVGPKMAQRVILELKDKMKTDELEIDFEDESDDILSDNRSEAISALVVLGYSSNDAQKAVKGIDGSLFDEDERFVTSDFISEDAEIEVGLRPRNLSEYIGQEKAKNNLEIYIKAALERREALDHVLLYGPPGLGKTTLASIIANEMGVNIRITSGPAIEKAGDLAAILTNLSEHDILFIDEIHRMSRTVEEILYPAMEDYALDIIIGKGPAAKSIRIDLPKFTLIGATTRAGLLTAPLRDRFGVISRLELYTVEEIKEIVKRSAGLLDVEIDDEGAAEIASRSRGTPRIANRFLKRVRDFAQVKYDGKIDYKVAADALKSMEVDELGLDIIDSRMIKTMIENFGGGPVGLDTLAATIGEEPNTIEDVYEPYLLQLGFISRTPRGRIATKAAYDHFDIPFAE